MVSIPGGEPLMHPQIGEIVEGLVARKKYIYLCTNALLLKEKTPSVQAQQVSDLFRPHGWTARAPRFFGLPEGGYDNAIEGIKAALDARFPRDHEYHAVRRRRSQERARLLRRDDGLGVEGMMLSPGYSYDKAPDQQHFLGRARTRRLFRAMLSNRKEVGFNQSPLFLEFLMGKREYACTPWGMPTFNVFGWQKPCYLLQDGYADTFEELMRDDRVGKLRHRVGQSQVRQLHGAQRIRSVGGERFVWFGGWHVAGSESAHVRRI